MYLTNKISRGGHHRRGRGLRYDRRHSQPRQLFLRGALLEHRLSPRRVEFHLLDVHVVPLAFSIDRAKSSNRLTLQFNRYAGVVNVIVTEESLGQRTHAAHGGNLLRAVRVSHAIPVVLRFDPGAVGFIRIFIRVFRKLRERVAQDRSLGVVARAYRFVLRVGEVRHARK